MYDEYNNEIVVKHLVSIIFNC